VKTGLAPVFLYLRKDGSAKMQEPFFADSDPAVLASQVCWAAWRISLRICQANITKMSR
jgi:hypothetical protein